MAMAMIAMLPAGLIVPTVAHRAVSPQMSMTEEAAKAAWLSRLEANTWGQGQEMPAAPQNRISVAEHGVFRTSPTLTLRTLGVCIPEKPQARARERDGGQIAWR